MGGELCPQALRDKHVRGPSHNYVDKWVVLYGHDDLKRPTRGGNALSSSPDVVQPVLARGTCVHIVGVFQSAIPAVDANNLG
ncbi:unnamed protein product [Nippostrongylus brasiliensis]|uniref:BRCT domain-containing protein n=1 Tax=Nippostrongylus brasiliensis TaxID=27835 RepID=A0A0N4YTV8_NIPBR|nr:unnamed protein product [Nippostrongylus brasiliensis]